MVNLMYDSMVQRVYPGVNQCPSSPMPRTRNRGQGAWPPQGDPGRGVAIAVLAKGMKDIQGNSGLGVTCLTTL